MNQANTEPDLSPSTPPLPSASPEPVKLDRRGALRLGGGIVAGLATAPVARAQDPTRLPILQRRTSCDTPIKLRAAGDYRHSLARFGGRLGNSIRELFLATQRPNEIHFAVAVIGSGYGASICAARLSQALRDDQRICILERGREWIPGEFPDTFESVWGNTRQQMSGPTRGQVTNPLGLYNISFNDEINVLSGNGLGGTSIINANVAMRPHSDTFRRSRWPQALQDIETLAPYYDLAARQLSLSRTPLDQVPKVRRRRLTAQALGGSAETYDRTPVAVMYDHRYLDEQMRNPQSMVQRECTLCGDCITGCNVGAKNSLVYNYLPVAKWNGAEMYTQVQVESIERHSGYYRIHLTYIDDSAGEITRHPLAVNSRVVVVSAGSPGSAEILMQSQNDRFRFSPALGCHWSANGDAVGFVVNLPESTRVGGFGAYCPPRGPVGSTVQTTLNFSDRPGLQNKMIFQDAAIPRGVSNLFGILLQDRHLDHSMAMLAMGHDEGIGRIIWKDGRYQICWPGMRSSEYRQRVYREFERIAAAEGGRYKKIKAFGDNLVSVHPLGGCAMADDPQCGVVNHLGQVFDGARGGWWDARTGEAAVHPGLYVADASIIPTALGVNPYLTICALSERIASHLIQNPLFADLFGQPG